MSTECFKLSQIGVVMLGAQNLARSLGFYRDRLGLVVRNEIRGFAFLDAGTVTLRLSEPLAKASSNTLGATEIVFPVETVGKAHIALEDKQVAFLNEPRNQTGSSWAANSADPDAHHLSSSGRSNSSHSTIAL